MRLGGGWFWTSPGGQGRPRTPAKSRPSLQRPKRTRMTNRGRAKWIFEKAKQLVRRDISLRSERNGGGSGSIKERICGGWVWLRARHPCRLGLTLDGSRVFSTNLPGTDARSLSISVAQAGPAFTQAGQSRLLRLPHLTSPRCPAPAKDIPRGDCASVDAADFPALSCCRDR